MEIPKRPATPEMKKQARREHKQSLWGDKLQGLIACEAALRREGFGQLADRKAAQVRELQARIEKGKK